MIIKLYWGFIVDKVIRMLIIYPSAFIGVFLLILVYRLLKKETKLKDQIPVVIGIIICMCLLVLATFLPPSKAVFFFLENAAYLK
jgi:hypothetical protein